MASAYVKNLIQTVITASNGNTWDVAVNEWEILDCEEDDFLSESCICGKENLRYLYTIRNTLNGNILYPIGSSCIKKFERDDLKEETVVREKLFKLRHAVENNEFISLNSELFSRKLLYFLYDDNAFRPNQYNDYDGYNDYEFLLDMFNKRDKNSISSKQQAKIRAIIVSSIRPYLKMKLRGKIRH